LVLSSNNTYTGATTVSAGVLGLSGSQASPVTVADGASLLFTLNDGSAPVATSTSTLGFATGATVTVLGTPVSPTIYPLYSASSITGTPVLTTPIAGYGLVVESNTLSLAPIAVADTTAPVITLSGSAGVSVNWGGSYSDAGATATDNVDTSVTVNVSGSVNTAKPGVYTLTYSASDVAGNPATPVTRTVTVAIANPTTVGADGYSPLLRYALGANSPTDTVQAPVLGSTATELSLTAIVRTDDTNLTIAGETTTDLNGSWTTAGVIETTAPDQSGVPAGGTRKVYKITLGGAKSFLRLKIIF
jgi:autotransporter-associated beta strand protein